MSHYKPYPAYKDFSAEWIGRVPEHWGATKLKYISAFTGGGTPAKENPDYWNGSIPWISPKDMKHEVVTDSIDHITPEGLANSATKLINSGAVLLVARSGILRHTIPVGINSVPVSLNQDMKALTLDESRVRPRFILRWVQGFNRALLDVWAKQGATVESLEHEYVANSPLPLPDLDEQDAILATLNRETARMDALIQNKNRFIELLKEKRQALITHAVTKGLAPNVKMKDSGVEWIGQVPEHWSVSRIKRHAVLRTERRNDFPTNQPYIGLEDVEAGSGLYKSTNGNSRQSSDSTVGIFYKGDVLYGKLRPYLRKAIVTEREGACSTEFLVMRTQKMLPWWLHQWLLTPNVTQQIEAGCDGAKMPRADWEHVGSIKIVVPDKREQDQILSLLNRETARIDSLIEKTEQSITLLKERRSAFITAAVTGQIDLRGEQ